MTLPIPIDDVAPVRDLADLAARVFRHARDVDNHLRGQPSVEVVRFDVDPAGLPLVVACRTPAGNVRAVARGKTVKKSDSSAVADTGLEWRQDGDGIRIDALSGCSAGTTYSVTLMVVGDREGRS